MAITALLVEPRWGRRGHGSRLLAAVVDLARTGGFRTGVTWVLQADTASLGIRLHASLLEEPAPEVTL
jgi:GNAT superfamily N-acetyltransferase